MTPILTHCLEWVTLPSRAYFVACILHVFSMHKAQNTPKASPAADISNKLNGI